MDFQVVLVEETGYDEAGEEVHAGLLVKVASLTAIVFGVADVEWSTVYVLLLSLLASSSSASSSLSTSLLAVAVAGSEVDDE